MKVLLVVHQYLPFHRAGTEIYTHSLAKELERRGHQVLVYCHEARLDGQGISFLVELYDGVRVRRVAAFAKREFLPWRRFQRTFLNPRIEADYAQVLEAWNPDVVHVQHLKDLSVGILEKTAARGVPLVMTLHDYWALCPNAQAIRPDGTICRWPHPQLSCVCCAAWRVGLPVLRFAAPLVMPLFWQRARCVREQLERVDRFISPSQFLLRRYVEAGFSPPKFFMLENGFDYKRLGSLVLRRKGWRGHYAYIGSLAWQKGVHILIRAFTRLEARNIRLRIRGNLETFPEYVRSLREQAGGDERISFEGELAENRIGEALAWADYLVVPSLWWENSPVTIQEAYAAGVPVIASQVGALQEKVFPGITGLLFHPGDVEDLVKVLRQTVGNQELFAALQAQLPRPPSIEEHVDQLELIYKRLEKG
ncbi:MAG: glycosyltransferase family 4 protein [Anaerolineae bacterium]|nr:glycosyltransferase family 4 protein [Anaerolineae bacterium]